MTRATRGFKGDVEGQEAIEQRRLAIEVSLLKAIVGDIVRSVLEKPKPLQGSKNPRLHRIRTRVPLTFQNTYDRDRAQTREALTRLPVVGGDR